jgi:cysteine desulfurase/selenocysteine lyase
MTTATRKSTSKARPATVRAAATPAPETITTYDVDKVRADFPILRQKIRGRTLVYLDNAATSQKPQSVINSVTRYYERDNANIHRGVHFLSEHATEEHESARTAIQGFLNAAHSKEIIFVRGTTEAINLVAQTYGRVHIGAGDEILITAMNLQACSDRKRKSPLSPMFQTRWARSLRSAG